MKNRIILITGPKHSGKSSCALALGKISGGEALDLDELVKKQTGKSPRELYTEGPEIFKKAEAAALAAIIQTAEKDFHRNQKPLIVATGGGLIDNPEALSFLSKRRDMRIVYLDLPPETAWQRIIKAGGELPPFLNTENPEETHRTLHERRAASYKSLAHLCIPAEDKTPAEIAGEIAKHYKH